MPFSNAYHDSQSSALMLLYAAITFVQHARAVGEGEPAACCVGELEAPPGPAPPPQAVARIARSDTSTTSVFVMSPPFRFARVVVTSPDLWPPRLESVLDALEDRGEQHSRARDEDHAGQHLRRLERLASDGDELADAVPCGDELCDDDTGECVADAQTEPGQDERDRPGEHH